METDVVNARKSLYLLHFDPTYEAWKPGIQSIGRTLNGNFDPTYEAWKLRRGEKASQETLDFDPTYEAWKLASVLFFSNALYSAFRSYL